MMQENMVRFVSHILFDGWISKCRNGAYTLGYANKNEILIKEFSDLVENITGKYPYRQVRPTATEIAFSNKKLFQNSLQFITLKKFLQKDFYNILISNKRFIQIILRAFWDDEGMVGFYNTKTGITRKLRARCQNEKLRKQLLMLHKILEINAYEEYDKKGILITERKSIQEFSSKINFTKGVKVLKGRGDKYTWRGVEKTEILRLLLNSYEN